MTKDELKEMKGVEMTLLDGKIYLGENNHVRNNTFILVYRVDFAELKIDTFWKRIKWLLTGKI